MKTHSTIAGNHYTVTSPNGGTVTDAAGKLNKVVGAGDQLTVMAPSEALYCSDDDADIRKANFKNARLALRMLGAGDNLLPSGYTRLEYLEFTGDTMIRLAVPVNNLFGLYFDYEKTLPIHTNDFPVSWQQSSPYRAFRLVFDEVNGGFIWWSNSNKLEYKNTEVQRTLWQANFKNNRRISVDSADHGHAELVLSDIDSDYDEVVFGRIFRLDNKATENGAYFKAYAIKLSSGSEVVYDLVPALDETGAPCMFDRVTRTPFYNAGTGDFIYPSATATYGLRRVLPDWGQLTERGLRRLYHAPANYKGELYDYALENGYKPIVEESAPEEGYWVPVWHDREDCIELEWVETEPPVDELSTIEA